MPQGPTVQTHPTQPTARPVSLVRNQNMVVGTQLSPCNSLPTSHHRKGRATLISFLSHIQEGSRSIQVLPALFPTCLPSATKNSLYNNLFMPLLTEKQHDDIYLTNRIKHILETSRVLLNAAQESQMFSQFYLCSSLHHKNFIKFVLFCKKNTRKVLLECSSFPCTSLPTLFAAGLWARTVLLSRFQSCFSLDGYWRDQIDKGQHSETLFKRNEGQSIAWQQVVCSAGGSRNTMTYSA